jgi:protein-disulfide isomerase
MSEVTLSQEEYKQVLENRQKKQSPQQFDTLEVAPIKKEEKLTLSDLVGVEEETNVNEEEDFQCGNCNAPIQKGQVKCNQCNEELVW